MAQRREKAEWVICGPDPHLATCTRCGEHEPKPTLPLAMEAFIIYMKYVVAKHKHCQPKSTETAQGEDQKGVKT